MASVPDIHALLEAVAGRGDLDSAIAEVRRLPDDDPRRGSLAAGLVFAIMRTNPLSGPARLDQIDGLLEMADLNPPPGPQWPRLRALARTTSMVGAAAEGRLADPVAALVALDTLMADAGVGDDPGWQAVFEAARLMLTTVRGFEEGDDSVYTQAQSGVEKLRRVAAGYPGGDRATDFLVAGLDLMTVRQRGGDVEAALDAIKAKSEQFPVGSYEREGTAELFAMMAPLRHLLGGLSEGAAVSGEQRAAAPTSFEEPTGPYTNDAQRALFHVGAGTAALDLGEETDLSRIGTAIDHFRAALALTAPDSPQRPLSLQSLALGLIRRNELTNSAVDADEAIDALKEARDLAGGPQHPTWQLVNEMLSHVQRRRGDPGPRESALEALRNNAWKVLLQGDAVSARYAARDAAGSAMDVARQCLIDGAPADALRALDGGRGLMLFAATEFSDVIPRLTAAGRPDLVERWQRAVISNEPDRHPTSLRRDVLEVLSQESGLLDPPSLGEIRDALRVLDADALVYLVPTSADIPGWAVIAPAGGPPSYMALPNLVVEKDLDVERYLSALANRDLAPATPQADLADSLDTLCDWAWRAAVGPLVDSFLPTLPKPATGRPHRLILVPMGELALIPWQAARRRDGTYAVQLVALSQTASARLLCRSAALAPVPAGPVGLVVGDPDTGDRRDQLLAARVEAYAIHQAFYRGGRYVGTRADGTPSRAGAGTGAELRDWLTTDRPGAGAMLHLACHGVIGGTDPQAATSYLLLAGGDRITAEEIIQLMARSPERAISLAVLAACRTGRSIHGYDEAYSLGTAFLAGGVRSVLSTQWAIPDGATSVLMFMFHHNLMVRRLPVWAALREAQLWMLDPDREPPSTMPARLHRELGQADVARIDGWAGFVHLGQ